MIQRLRARHAEAYHRRADDVVPLPGSKELLDTLTAMSVPWAIATSGRIEAAGVNLRALVVDPDKNVVVTRDQVRFAKPDPDLFVEAARRLEVPIEHAVVVGDSAWEDRKCKRLNTSQ